MEFKFFVLCTHGFEPFVKNEIQRIANSCLDEVNSSEPLITISFFFDKHGILAFNFKYNIDNQNKRFGIMICNDDNDDNNNVDNHNVDDGNNNDDNINNVNDNGKIGKDLEQYCHHPCAIFVQKLCQLKCLDSVFSFVDYFENIPIKKEEGLKQIYLHSTKSSIDANWKNALDLFEILNLKKLKKRCIKLNFGKTNDNQKDVKSNSMFREWFPVIYFRGTGKRSVSRMHNISKKHEYNSQHIACAYADGVNDRFGWKINLENYDLDLYIEVIDDFAFTGIRISPLDIQITKFLKQQIIPETIYPRLPKLFDDWYYLSTVKIDFRVQYGKTSIKLSTAYNLIRTAMERHHQKLSTLNEKKDVNFGIDHLIDDNRIHKLYNNEIIFLDCFCGCGTISLVAACNFPEIDMIFGCDLNNSAIKASQENQEVASEILYHEYEKLKTSQFFLHQKKQFPNIHHIKSQLSSIDTKVQFFRADTKKLPLADASLNMIVTDMPFGVRSGNHHENKKKYSQFLKELKRIVMPGGTIVLLTLERKLVENYLSPNQISSHNPQKKSKKCLKLHDSFIINMNGLYPHVYIIDVL